MDHPLDILINDLEGEVRDRYMVEAEFAHDAEVAMQEGMPEPVEVSGLGRPFPGTHPSAQAISRVSRSWSPRCKVNDIPF